MGWQHAKGQGYSPLWEREWKAHLENKQAYVPKLGSLSQMCWNQFWGRIQRAALLYTLHSACVLDPKSPTFNPAYVHTWLCKWITFQVCLISSLLLGWVAACPPPLSSSFLASSSQSQANQKAAWGHNGVVTDGLSLKTTHSGPVSREGLSGESAAHAPTT